MSSAASLCPWEWSFRIPHLRSLPLPFLSLEPGLSILCRISEQAFYERTGDEDIDIPIVIILILTNMRKSTDPSPAMRQCVGIDISKETFTAAFRYQDIDEFDTDGPRTFDNNKKGYNQLVRWSRKNAHKGHHLCFVMEPTSVYHLPLATHLVKLNLTVHLIPGRRIKKFIEEEGKRSKTDNQDAAMMARFGCQKPNLPKWELPESELVEIRTLSRLRTSLVKHKTASRGVLESLTHGGEVSRKAVSMCEATIKHLEQQIAEVEKTIRKLVRSNDRLKKVLDLMMTMPGIGETAAVTIISETMCFSGMTGRGQVVKYAGLDVIAKQSGKCDPKRHISKCGNAHIRAILYVCAMSAIRHDDRFRVFYSRIKASHPDGKVAIVAVMRKMLTNLFAMYKTGIPYQRNAR